MPKYNNAKNYITDLSITSQKRKTTTQVKVQTMKKSADKTSAHAQSYNLRAKVHQYQTIRLQTWPNATTNRNVPKLQKFLKQKNSQSIFKNKKMDQSDLRCFSTRKHG